MKFRQKLMKSFSNNLNENRRIFAIFLKDHEDLRYVFDTFLRWFFTCRIPKVQRDVNLIDLVKSFPTSIWLRHLASIAKRTSPLKFAKSELDELDN